VGNSKQVDEIDSKLSFQISIPLAILFIVTIYLFNKKKNHHLINYRPLILCKIAAIGSAIYCVVLPVSFIYIWKKYILMIELKNYINYFEIYVLY